MSFFDNYASARISDDGCTAACYIGCCCCYLIFHNLTNSIEKIAEGNYLKGGLQFFGSLAGLGATIYIMAETLTPSYLYHLVVEAEKQEDVSKWLAVIAGLVASSAYVAIAPMTGYNIGGLVGRGIAEGLHGLKSAIPFFSQSSGERTVLLEEGQGSQYSVQHG